MKKTSQPKAKAKASKPATKPATRKAKASAPAPVAVMEKSRADSLTTFRLPAELKEALVSHAFSAGYDGNMSRALVSILRQALQ
jgi:hypothetical protein